MDALGGSPAADISFAFDPPAEGANPAEAVNEAAVLVGPATDVFFLFINSGASATRYVDI
jgi:hypothetical protein